MRRARCAIWRRSWPPISADCGPAGATAAVRSAGPIRCVGSRPAFVSACADSGREGSLREEMPRGKGGAINFLSLTARPIGRFMRSGGEKYLQNPKIRIIFAHAKAIDYYPKIYRGMEQLAARRAHNPKVGGSSPPPATTADNSKELSAFFVSDLLQSAYAVREIPEISLYKSLTIIYSPEHAAFGRGGCGDSAKKMSPRSTRRRRYRYLRHIALLW